MTRVVNQQATKIARARHRLGVDYLNDLFGVTTQDDGEGHMLPPPRRVFAALVRADKTGEPGGRGRPFRMTPNVPPVRDAWHQARHERNKRARASRKANRS